MESSSPTPVVAVTQGNEDGGARPKRRLTQEEIEYAMAMERIPFQPRGLDLIARLPHGDVALAALASAVKHVEELQDMRMEYKERVLREYAAKGYVELTDHEDDEKEDNEWDHDMVF